MANSPQRYDHPGFLITREHPFIGPATASGTVGPLVPQQKILLKAIHSFAAVAGTNVAANTYTINGGVHGTTSVGAVAIGTSTVNTIARQEVNLTVDRGEVLSLVKGADATGVTYFNYEYVVLPDAVVT